MAVVPGIADDGRGVMDCFPAKAGTQSFRRRRWSLAFAGEQGVSPASEFPER
jgi:hypothetical protein